MHTVQQLQSGDLTGSKAIKISEGLNKFPVELFKLAATLEILDLSGNHLNALPYDFYRLQNLRILFLSDNDFIEFPKVLGECINLEMIGFKANQITHIPEDSLPPKLRWLILTNNRLTHLPKSIASCKQMQKLMLAGNMLRELPEEMSGCQKLELLRISANRFEALPLWLLSLPRLSWLAYAGNPFCETKHTGDHLSEIFWNELELQEQLGQGASGVITKALWKSNWPTHSSKEVAVKVFKGEVTSDGLPFDEMNACIASGKHSHLIQVLGKIVQHPQHKKGLVFELISSSFKNLGNPPSFETCTRDVYNEGTSFSVNEIICISLGIASAAAHLHTRGLMHGDLYAHNILIDENAYPLFGDFGAAAFYEVNDDTLAPALQHLEVRAFGCLLDDLLVHVAPEYLSHPSLSILSKLRDKCMQEEVVERPDFISIQREIGEINKTE